MERRSEWLRFLRRKQLLFLGEFVNVNKPFRKDGGNKTGRGKGWIAAMISRNRCIPFKEFIRRMDDR